MKYWKKVRYALIELEESINPEDISIADWNNDTELISGEMFLAHTYMFPDVEIIMKEIQCVQIIV